MIENIQEFLKHQLLDKVLLVVAAIITFFIVEVPIADHKEKLERKHYVDKKKLDAAAEVWPPLYKCLNSFTKVQNLMSGIISDHDFPEKVDTESTEKMLQVIESFSDESYFHELTPSCVEARKRTDNNHFWLGHIIWWEINDCIDRVYGMPIELVNEWHLKISSKMIKSEVLKVMAESLENKQHHLYLELKRTGILLADIDFRSSLKSDLSSLKLKQCKERVTDLIESFKM